MQTRYRPEAHVEERWEYLVDADGACCFPVALASCSKPSLQVLMYQSAWPEPISAPRDLSGDIMRIKRLYKDWRADFSPCILTSSPPAQFNRFAVAPAAILNPPFPHLYCWGDAAKLSIPTCQSRIKKLLEIVDGEGAVLSHNQGWKFLLRV